MEPEALEMKEAIGTELSLKNVPAKGATALIPVPPLTDPDDLVELRINAKVVVPAQSPGPDIGGYYELLIPRTALLDNLGAGRTFDYIHWAGGANDQKSKPVQYDITH
ncbi:hypothetical protein [Pseudomonas gozinkensis]|uniref:hypothetical protein n=1 Tax=Pseudomonas gozinkensis TaxID=2774461 RepID=UPI001787FA4B|nr:hypothetical protein [Pseudomonas gozinkensis]